MGPCGRGRTSEQETASRSVVIDEPTHSIPNARTAMPFVNQYLGDVKLDYERVCINDDVFRKLLFTHHKVI